ncbi:MAG TPA: hypothetical protein DCZ91_00745 [Lachnospiraceae bacterium]|nr:hypothetical protein [Lachnospiraceae bacterium]
MENRFEKKAGAEGYAEENLEKQELQRKYPEYPALNEDAGEAAVWRKHEKRKFHPASSPAAKIIGFFLLVVSSLTGFAAVLLCMYMESLGLYSKDSYSILMDIMAPEYQNIAYTAEKYIEQGNVEDISGLCEDFGFEVQLIYVTDAAEEIVIWDSAIEDKTGFPVDIGFIFDQKENEVRINGRVMRDGRWYLLRIYIDRQRSNIGGIAEKTEYMYSHRYSLIIVAAGAVILCLISFIFLVCSAGQRNGREGIVTGMLTRIHLDVLTVLFGGVAASVVLFTASELNFSSDIVRFAMMVLVGTGLVVWMTVYFMELARRLKCGLGWRYSLIYVILRQLGRSLCFLGRELAALVRGIPLVLTTVTVYLGICILELLGVLIFVRRAGGVFLWAVEKVALLFVVLYIALICRKLLQASRKLADGQENYRVDTAGMFGAFKEHGENLNSLGLGISKAVEARTKSERMKTELISNVSHDLKTPLTSIINYADLIWEEVNSERNASGSHPSGGGLSENTDVGEDGKIKEYAEVLLRQSRRLKKLLEDLLEASKATTGNLEVNLEPCEVGVLLSQAVGEYQQRMEEKHLELIARQPQEGVNVLADGRRLWRVFENLLNNIVKYSSENSRVYLNVEAKENEVLIIFRNMSKYPLEVTAEELAERFVRGDKSRHMEGNGLGLSIAKSLVELQNGRMEIVIDGDLFKVILYFPLYSQEQESAVQP